MDIRDFAYINDGLPWSADDISLLDEALWHGDTLQEAAELLCRGVEEVSSKATELGLFAARQ